MLPGLTAALAASIGYGTASVLEAVAARRVGGAKVYAHPLYLAGIGLDLLAWLCSLLALQHLTLFTVQALLAGSLVVTMLLARWVFASELSRAQLLAMGLLIAGLAVLALSTGTQPAQPAAQPLVWTLAGALLVLAAALAVLYRKRAPKPTAVLAGLAASGAALGARGLVLDGGVIQLLREPMLWLVLGFGVVAMAGYTRALEFGHVGPATAVFTVIEVVVPGIAGMLLLGDAAREGWELAKYGAIALSLGSCLWLTLGSPGAGLPAEPALKAGGSEREHDAAEHGEGSAGE